MSISFSPKPASSKNNLSCNIVFLLDTTLVWWFNHFINLYANLGYFHLRILSMCLGHVAQSSVNISPFFSILPVIYLFPLKIQDFSMTNSQHYGINTITKILQCLKYSRNNYLLCVPNIFLFVVDLSTKEKKINIRMFFLPLTSFSSHYFPTHLFFGHNLIWLKCLPMLRIFCFGIIFKFCYILTYLPIK